MSELNLINFIKSHTENIISDDLVKGIGDDCSVVNIENNNQLLISTDTLVDNIHFNRNWHPPELLGRKTMAVNLSDIAAMGGIPKFVQLSITLSSDISDDWIRRWLLGVFEILKQYNCLLIGGDTVRGTEFSASVTIIGSMADGLKPIYRSGAKITDTIFISNYTGLAAAGLEMLANSLVMPNDETNKYNQLLNAHLSPIPRLELSHKMAESGLVTAMQDISDGIATDLSHISSESSVGALIYEEKLPLHSQLAVYANSSKLNNNLDFMLRGGDDYELLFTVISGKEKEIEEIAQNVNEKITPIGKIVEGKGVILERKDGAREDISYQGYQH